jgi:hypothetical protein
MAASNDNSVIILAIVAMTGYIAWEIFGFGTTRYEMSQTDWKAAVAKGKENAADIENQMNLSAPMLDTSSLTQQLVSLPSFDIPSASGS